MKRVEIRSGMFPDDPDELALMAYEPAEIYVDPQIGTVLAVKFFESMSSENSIETWKEKMLTERPWETRQ